MMLTNLQLGTNTAAGMITVQHGNLPLINRVQPATKQHMFPIAKKLAYTHLYVHTCVDIQFSIHVCLYIYRVTGWSPLIFDVCGQVGKFSHGQVEFKGHPVGVFGSCLVFLQPRCLATQLMRTKECTSLTFCTQVCNSVFPNIILIYMYMYVHVHV